MIARSNAPPPTISAGRMQPVARFAWLALAYNIAVMVWGAYVRATGSGAGCGNHWPLCNGSVLPSAPQIQTAIEFLHRVTSGLAVILVASLAVWCWRKTSKGDWPRYSAVLAMVLLLNEALLGALLVVFNHAAQDGATGHAILLCLHFGNTLLLIASLSLTARWLSDDKRSFALTAKPRELVMIGLGLAIVMTIGITGSLAAFGDMISPPTSLQASLTQDFSSSSHYLLRLRLLHPVTAALGAVYIFWIMLTNLSRQVHASRTRSLLIGTLILQGGLGAMNVVLLAPIWLQITHLVVADLFWILLVFASADVALMYREFPQEVQPMQATEPSRDLERGLSS